MCRITILLLLICLASCGGYVEQVSQKAEKGFLKFTGNTQSVTVSIDNNNPFSIEQEDPDKEVVYEVKPGNHSVKAYRGTQLVVNRTVYVNNQVTMEIPIP